MKNNSFLKNEVEKNKKFLLIKAHDYELKIPASLKQV
jgi:hypothetical protein